MFGNKGYRAREAAAKLRNTRKLVTDEVRAARANVLPDNVGDQPEAEVEVPVTDETNSTPTEAEVAEKEVAEKASAEKAAAAELAAAEKAEKAEKVAADKAAKVASDKAKAKKKDK